MMLQRSLKSGIAVLLPLLFFQQNALAGEEEKKTACVAALMVCAAAVTEAMNDTKPSECTPLRNCKKECRSVKKDCKKECRSAVKDCKDACRTVLDRNEKKSCLKGCRNAKADCTKTCKKDKKVCKDDCRLEFKTPACTDARKRVREKIFLESGLGCLSVLPFCLGPADRITIEQ